MPRIWMTSSSRSAISLRVVRQNYRVGVPRPGYYREILNTDSRFYEGTDLGNAGGVNAEPIPWNDRPYSIKLKIPALSVMYFKP